MTKVGTELLLSTNHISITLTTLTMIKPGSVEVGPPAKEGEGRARRSFVNPDELSSSPSPDVKVLADILVKAVKEFPTTNVSTVIPAPTCTRA